MLAENDFIRGIVPDVTWCLGIELRPFCAGHSWLLRRVKSPFLGYPGEISYKTVREAVLVLSNTLEDGRRLLNSPWSNVWLWLWHWRLTWFGILPVDVNRAALTVIEHVRKAYKFRPVEIPNSEAQGPHTIQSPEELVLVVQLMSKLHMSFDEAANCPWALAHWLHGAAAEMTGLVDLGTEEGLRQAKVDADEAHAKIAELVAKGVFARQ